MFFGFGSTKVWHTVQVSDRGFRLMDLKSEHSTAQHSTEQKHKSTAHKHSPGRGWPEKKKERAPDGGGQGGGGPGWEPKIRVFPLPTLFFLQFPRSFEELRWLLRVFITENVFTTNKFGEPICVL